MFFRSGGGERFALGIFHLKPAVFIGSSCPRSIFFSFCSLYLLALFLFFFLVQFNPMSLIFLDVFPLSSFFFSYCFFRFIHLGYVKPLGNDHDLIPQRSINLRQSTRSDNLISDAVYTLMLNDHTGTVPQAAEADGFERSRDPYGGH